MIIEMKKKEDRIKTDTKTFHKVSIQSK